MIRRCDLCQNWIPTGTVGEGQCRGAPPTATPDGTSCIWPVTMEHEFCAAWRLSEKLISEIEARGADA